MDIISALRSTTEKLRDWVDAKVDAVSDLVGDTPVSEQITKAIEEKPQTQIQMIMWEDDD